MHTSYCPGLIQPFVLASGRFIEIVGNQAEDEYVIWMEFLLPLLNWHHRGIQLGRHDHISCHCNDKYLPSHEEFIHAWWNIEDELIMFFVLFGELIYTDIICIKQHVRLWQWIVLPKWKHNKQLKGNRFYDDANKQSWF